MVNRKRILYIHHGDWVGGALYSLAESIKRLDAGRFQAVVALPRPGPASELLEESGAGVFFGPVSSFIHSTHHSLVIGDAPFLAKNLVLAIPNMRFVRSLIRDLDPAVVHLNSSVLLASGLAARTTGVPVVWHIRENLASGHFGLRRHVVRMIVGACSSRTITCSQATARALAVPGTQVIYETVDPAELAGGPPRELVARELGLPPDGRYVGMIGNLIAEKGYYDFLEAAKLLSQEDPKTIFIIVGYKPPEGSGRGHNSPVIPAEELDRVFSAVRATGCGRTGPFVFTGFRKDLRPIFSLLDVVIFPSWDEPLARIVLQAGAAGKPVVGTRSGGTVEEIVDGETGLLVPPRDPETIAAATLRLLQNDDLRRRMGEAATHRVKSHFHPRQAAEAIQTVYEELLRPVGQHGVGSALS
ncbi:MAG: glycosyltransferase family 4 protein [Chloroflexi bacterium]|nr:glycosyltransferase family 4 protein [Chloroflexota bacterium]